MRALLSAAVFLGGCTVPITHRLAAHVGFTGEVSDHSHARTARSFVGLRLSVVPHP